MLTGMEKENVDPFPCSLSTQILPLCFSTMLRAIASPRPVLRSFPVGLTLVVLNGRNSLACSFAGMPGPWSRTEKTISFGPYW